MFSVQYPWLTCAVFGLPEPTTVPRCSGRKVLPIKFAVLFRVQVAHSLGDFASAEIGAISMTKLEKFRENFIVFCLGDVIKINLSILLGWGFFSKGGNSYTPTLSRKGRRPVVKGQRSFTSRI